MRMKHKDTKPRRHEEDEIPGQIREFRRPGLIWNFVFFVSSWLGVFVFSLSAQWVNVPLPNTPRTPDGKPNLAAPAPKTPDGRPDLSGIWRVAEGRYLQNIAVELGEAPFQPWAAALYKERS